MPLGHFMQSEALQRAERRSMDNMIIAVINGEERPLNYSVEIMFKVNEKYGGVNAALDAIEAESVEAAANVCWLAIELANDGELCRRIAGHTPRKMLGDKDVSLRMSPMEYIDLKEKVIQAIHAGYRRETASEKEVDLGLAELNEKKARVGA